MPSCRKRSFASFTTFEIGINGHGCKCASRLSRAYAQFDVNSQKRDPLCFHCRPIRLLPADSRGCRCGDDWAGTDVGLTALGDNAVQLATTAPTRCDSSRRGPRSSAAPPMRSEQPTHWPCPRPWCSARSPPWTCTLSMRPGRDRCSKPMGEQIHSSCECTFPGCRCPHRSGRSICVLPQHRLARGRHGAAQGRGPEESAEGDRRLVATAGRHRGRPECHDSTDVRPADLPDSDSRPRWDPQDPRIRQSNVVGRPRRRLPPLRRHTTSAAVDRQGRPNRRL